MSQRRAVAATKVTQGGDEGVKEVPVEENTKAIPVTGSLSLEQGDETEPLSLDERYEITKKQIRLKKWRESPFAVGLTEPTWMEERQRGSGVRPADDEVPPDDSGCLWCSGQICPLLGAERVGNMAVLHSSTVWVEEVEVDEETGERKVKGYSRPSLNVVVGPYWPMVFCVTYPLIFAVSGYTFKNVILPGEKPFAFSILWAVLTCGLIVALGLTALRDPGIMLRQENPPPEMDSSWRWTDQARTYRPRGAFYDSDTAVVVEGFDHTCPWTGTAIGKKNMFTFQCFVCLVFLCMIVDIFLLTGAL